MVRHVLVLGDQDDAKSYSDYASKQGIKTRFVKPTPSERVAARIGDFRGACRNHLSGKSAPEDIISFNDMDQVIVDGLKVCIGMPSRDTELIARFCDKKALREIEGLTAHVVPCVALDDTETLSCFADEVIEKFGFPLVVKPSNAFYSAGVARCDDRASFEAGIKRAHRVARVVGAMRGSATVLAEPYFEGQEFAVDGFVDDETVYPIQLHQKLPELVGPFFHEHAYLTTCLIENNKLDHVVEFTRLVVVASGLRNSAFHLEYRENNQGQRRVLEIAPRIPGGGTTGQALARIVGDLDMYGMLHAINCREFVPPNPVRDRLRFGLEYDFATAEEGRLVNVSELKDACAKLGATELYQNMQDGDLIRQEGQGLKSCLTAFFSRDTRSDALALFNEIHANLKIRVT